MSSTYFSSFPPRWLLLLFYTEEKTRRWSRNARGKDKSNARGTIWDVGTRHSWNFLRSSFRKRRDDKEGVGVAFRNSRKLQCWMRRGATLFTTSLSFFLFPCYFFFLFFPSFFFLFSTFCPRVQEQRRRSAKDRRRPWHRAKKTVICSSGGKRGLSLSSPHCHLRLNADKCISHSTRCFVPKNFFFSIRPMVSSFKRLFAPKGTVLLSPWGNYKPL